MRRRGRIRICIMGIDASLRTGECKCTTSIKKRDREGSESPEYHQISIVKTKLERTVLSFFH